MKHLLRWIIGLLLAAAIALLLNGFFRDNAFVDEHPAPGKLYGPPGSRVHAIEVAGKGDHAVVFLHGDPGTALDFALVQKRLSPGVRTFAFDRPGYGWSERPQGEMGPRAQAVMLHAAVKQLQLQRPVIAGFSYGGPVAIAYALEYPDEVGALALIAPVADPVEGHPMHGAQANLVLPVVGPLIAFGAGPIVAPDAVAQGYADAFYPQQPDDEVVALGRLHFSRASVLLASARDWKVLETELPELAKRYESLDMPVEVVWGRQDKIVGDSHARYLMEHVKTAKLVTVENCGHQMMSTHPEDVVEV
ncbi:MAG TPA: alpha/beta hydrolase, partial [Dongiaceae bacterium]|nr:alpha/beta hydrolase [Dongiaceae bacterium]